MKKFLALVLVAMMALGMVATATAEADPIKVGVCIYQFNDPFMTLYRTELQKYLEESYGAQVTVVDGKNDQTEQTNQINGFIADQVDVLIINLVQATSASTIIDLVQAAGIPTVFINREPSEEDMTKWEGKITYVGADARQSGTFQGEIVAATANKGDINGNGAVDYVMIVGDPENVDAQYRTEFSIKALTDAGLTVNKLFEQRGDWMQENGQQLAANALAQFGKDIDVIFCNNDAMALGAYQAILDAGRVVNEDIYLLGVDALAECVEMVSNGTMTGTVLNDHTSQSHTAADVAMKVAQGEALDAYYWVDYTKVTAENAAEFMAAE